MFPILSIDGGGIRGIIPAMVLAELERRTGRAVHELFRLVAGTSTGGILALGLTAPGEEDETAARFTAQDLVDLYEDEGARIFSRSPWHRTLALGNLLEEKYPAAGIESVLRERFGDLRISEALTPVLVTAYDIEIRGPHFFKSHKARTDPTRDYLMRDAARATSAAPTYFEPAYVRVRPEADPVSLVDGGVFANNPAACALVEALCEFEQAQGGGLALLSLGTGEMTRPILQQEAEGWGLAEWAQPLLSVVFDGVNDTVAYQVASLLGALAGPDRYLRVQTALHEGNDEMDDTRATNLRVLKLLGREVIRSHDRELDQWAALLTEEAEA